MGVQYGLCPPGGSTAGVGGLQYQVVSTRGHHCPWGCSTGCVNQGAALPGNEGGGQYWIVSTKQPGEGLAAVLSSVKQGSALPSR